jgi:hypothetical protein
MHAFRPTLPALALAVALGAKAGPISSGFNLFSTGPSVQPIQPPRPSQMPVNVTFQAFPFARCGAHQAGNDSPSRALSHIATQ